MVEIFCSFDPANRITTSRATLTTSLQELHRLSGFHIVSGVGLRLLRCRLYLANCNHSSSFTDLTFGVSPVSIQAFSASEGLRWFSSSATPLEYDTMVLLDVKDLHRLSVTENEILTVGDSTVSDGVWVLEWTFSLTWSESRPHSAVHISAVKGSLRSTSTIADYFSCLAPASVPQWIPLPISHDKLCRTTAHLWSDDVLRASVAVGVLRTATNHVTYVPQPVLQPLVGFNLLLLSSPSGFGAVLPAISLCLPTQQKQSQVDAFSAVEVIACDADGEAVASSVASVAAVLLAGRGFREESPSPIVSCATQQPTGGPAAVPLCASDDANRRHFFVVILDLGQLASAHATEGILVADGVMFLDTALASTCFGASLDPSLPCNSVATFHANATIAAGIIEAANFCACSGQAALPPQELICRNAVARVLSMTTILSKASERPSSETIALWVEYALEFSGRFHAEIASRLLSPSDIVSVVCDHSTLATALAVELVGTGLRMPTRSNAIAEQQSMLLELLRSQLSHEGVQKYHNALVAVFDAMRRLVPDDLLFRGSSFLHLLRFVLGSAGVAAAPPPAAVVLHALLKTSPVLLPTVATLHTALLPCIPVHGLVIPHSGGGHLPVRLYLLSPANAEALAGSKQPTTHTHEAALSLSDCPTDGVYFTHVEVFDAAIPLHRALKPHVNAQAGSALILPCSAPHLPSATLAELHAAQRAAALLLSVADPLCSFPTARCEFSPVPNGLSLDDERLLFSWFHPSNAAASTDVRASWTLLRKDIAASRPMLMLRVCRQSPFDLVRRCALENVRCFLQDALKRREDPEWDAAIRRVCRETATLVTHSIQHLKWVAPTLTSAFWPVSWPSCYQTTLYDLLAWAHRLVNVDSLARDIHGTASLPALIALNLSRWPSYQSTTRKRERDSDLSLVQLTLKNFEGKEHIPLAVAVYHAMKQQWVPQWIVPSASAAADPNASAVNSVSWLRPSALEGSGDVFDALRSWLESFVRQHPFAAPLNTIVDTLRDGAIEF